MADPTQDPGASPAATEARTELSRIQTDPTHPLHAAWKRNDGEAVTKHLEPFYRKIQGSETPALEEKHFTSGSAADSEARQAEALAKFAPIKQTLIESADFPEWSAATFGTNVQHANAGAQHLVHHVFGGDQERWSRLADTIGDEALGMELLRQVGAALARKTGRK